MKKNWFFILMLSISALALAGTAAWFSVFGLTQLFYGAGIGITILAASLEFAKVVTVSYVYRFWTKIEKGLRGFYIFAVLFIMFLTSMGIYGFLISGYQKSANKIELRDAQIKISDNKRILFVNQLDRINKSIESSTQRINTISGLRTQQEKRLDNLYSQKYISVAKRTETQISGSDEQIKILSEDITIKMKQSSSINDSVAFYDQRIAELKASEVNNEISSYQFISDLTGISMNKVVNFVAFVIIFVFDPLAIALLIAVNRLTMNKEETENKYSLWSKLKRRFKKEVKEKIEKKPDGLIKEINEEITLNPVKIEEIITPEAPEKTVTPEIKDEIVKTEENVEEIKEEIILEPLQIKEEKSEVKNEIVKTEENVEEIKEETSEVKNEILEPAQIKNEIRNFHTMEKPKEYDEFEPKQVASVTGRVNVAHFVPRQS